MAIFESTKVIELGSCAFRQPRAKSHCRFLHGYRLTAKFWFGCNELDENHWCMDFGALKNLKHILENQFDHTTCIAADDPALPLLKVLRDAEVIDLRIMEHGTGIERIAEWCHKAANDEIKLITAGRCWVTKVEVWEHEKNSATYTHKPSVNTAPTDEEVEEYFRTLGEPVRASTSNAPQQASKIPDPIPASVGNPKSSGLGNPFGGTSWSAKSGDSLR